MQSFLKGQALTINWHLTKPNGSTNTPFSLASYTCALEYHTGTGVTSATGVVITGTNNNIIQWVFAADKQSFIGPYTLVLRLYENNVEKLKIVYRDAFAIVKRSSQADSGFNSQASQNNDNSLTLFTTADYWQFQRPTISAGNDGYWYFEGTKVKDGSNNDVPTKYNLFFKSATNQILVYEGVIAQGATEPSAAQIVSTIDTLSTWLTAANTALGSSSDTASESGSMWARYKYAEAQRQSAETARANAETSRASAETARVAAEALRVSAETGRANAESSRTSAESGRVSAETGRANAESSRTSAESGRVSAETSRASAEASRANAEAARVAAETARHTQYTADHAQAGTDHSTATSDHTRAESDHQQISSKLNKDTKTYDEAEDIFQDIEYARESGEMAVGDASYIIPDLINNRFVRVNSTQQGSTDFYVLSAIDVHKNSDNNYDLLIFVNGSTKNELFLLFDQGYGSYLLEYKGEIAKKSDLSGFITNTVNNLVNYYKKTETYTQTEIAALLAEKQAVINDLATIRSGAALGATALQTVPATYRTAADQDTIDTALAGSVTSEAVRAQAAEASKADKTGEYNDFIAGAAKSLIGHNGVVARFTRRASGGGSDIATGPAVIKRIKGNAVAWNQQVGIDTASVTIPIGHKYLFKDASNSSTTIATSDGTAMSVVGGSDMVIDLTLMFGAGNEPATVAEFRTLFPLDYYAYNAGTVLGNKASKLLTNGFNQWDEEWEAGYLWDGQPQAGGSVRSKNFIPVLPATSYGWIMPGVILFFVSYYDADKVCLSANEGTMVYLHQTFTTPANAAYIKFYYGDGITPIYAGGGCINLHHSGARDEQYEPYTQSDKVLNLSTLTGKVGGQGASSVIFADGMIGRGALYDTIEVVEGQLKMAVKRWGRVDLGSLNWYYSGAYFGTVGIKALITPPVSRSTDYGICSRYAWSGWEACTDKTYSVDTDGELKITDSAYSDAASFKAAMSGVYLYYELEAPVEYILDVPISPNYHVDDYGLEWVLPENGSTPTTAPILYDVTYAINAVDTIRNIDRNHPNATSIGNLLAALKIAGVIANYTMTWSAATRSYVFTITPNS